MYPTERFSTYPEELLDFIEREASLEVSLDPVFLEHAYLFYLLGQKTNQFPVEVQEFLDECIDTATYSIGQEFLESIQGTDINSIILTFPDGLPNYVSEYIPNGYLDTTLATVASAIEYLRTRDTSNFDLLLEKESLLYPIYLLGRGHEDRIPDAIEESNSRIKKENIILLASPEEFPQVYSQAHGIMIPISPEGLYGVIVHRFLNAGTPITPEEFKLAFEEEITFVKHEWEKTDQTDPFSRLMQNSSIRIIENMDEFVNKAPTYSTLYNARWN